MNNDEKILKALEELQSGQKALQTDVSAIKDVQQKQGTQLAALQTEVKGLHGKVDTVELKVEAIHATSNKPTMRLWINCLRATRLPARPNRRLRSGLHALKSI
jgi:predicted nuclease with TOPRIM domain